MMSAQSSWTAEAVANIPLSLYLHWPWCVRKCPYCDFNSHAAPADLAEREYVDIVLKDLEGWLSVAGGPSNRNGLHWRRHAEPDEW